MDEVLCCKLAILISVKLSPAQLSMKSLCMVNYTVEPETTIEFVFVLNKEMSLVNIYYLDDANYGSYRLTF